ncbi:hypothetical protein ACHZNU_004592 [Salmonella enterica]
MSQGRPKDFTEQLKGCNGNPSCEQGVRKDMARESAENILKLKSCWDAGDAAHLQLEVGSPVLNLGYRLPLCQ